MASQNDILTGLTDREPTHDLQKKFLNHENGDKADRLANMINVFANEIEPAYQSGHITAEERKHLYSVAQEHIKDTKKGIGGVTGYLDSTEVDRYEAGKRDRKG